MAPSALDHARGSVCVQLMWQEIKAFFPDGALKLERTLCIVKPDAIANLAGLPQSFTD